MLMAVLRAVWGFISATPAIVPLVLLSVGWLAENAHPFKDPPLRMNSPFGLFGLTS